MQRNTSERLRPNDVYFFAASHVNLFCSKDEIDAFNLNEREYITMHDVRPGAAPLVGQGAKPNQMVGNWASRATLYSRPSLPRVRLTGDPFAFPDPPCCSPGEPSATLRSNPAARLLRDLLAEQQPGK